MGPSPIELPEDDGMKDLRLEIQRTHSSTLTLGQKGAQIYALMNDSQRKQVQWEAKASNTILSIHKNLPEREAIPPHLEGLPVELVESIAQHLSLRDFGRFRLSSSILRAKSRHYFNTRFFSHRVIHAEWESLRKLMVILCHEDFGPVVRNLVLDAPCKDIMFHAHRAGPRIGPGALNRGPLIPAFYQPTPAMGQVWRQRQYPSVFSQTTMPTPQHHVSMLLGRIFGRINHLQSLTFQYFPSARDMISMGTLHDFQQDRNVYARELTHWYNGRELDVDVLRMTLAAVAEGGTEITSLGLGAMLQGRYQYFRLHDMDTGLIPPHCNALHRAFRSTKVVRMILHVGDNPGVCLPESSLRFPGALLNLTPNVEQLDIFLGPTICRCPPGIADHKLLIGNTSSFRAFEYISKTVWLPKLIKCTLASLQLTTDTLKRFLSSSTNSIKEVHLCDIWLSREANAVNIKAYLAENLHLQAATMTRITASDIHERLADARFSNGIWQTV